MVLLDFQIIALFIFTFYTASQLCLFGFVFTVTEEEDEYNFLYYTCINRVLS